MRGLALLEFSRIGFMNMLAFRLRYYTGVITYFINVTVYYFIWKAVYSADPEYASLSFIEMVTYVAVGWIIRSMYFNNIDNQMASDILEGKISMLMLKPVNVQWSYIARALGESAFRVVMLTAPTNHCDCPDFPHSTPGQCRSFRSIPDCLGRQRAPGGGVELYRWKLRGFA